MKRRFNKVMLLITRSLLTKRDIMLLIYGGSIYSFRTRLYVKYFKRVNRDDEEARYFFN